MMLHAASLLLTLALTVTPPGRAQDRPIRAGTWELMLTFGGGLLAATLDIAYRGDTLAAALRLGEHESPVRAGKRDGSTLELEPTSPSMDVRYHLVFVADSVKGTFTFQGQDGDVTGVRRRREP